MIYCVEDDAGIRELVVYTLRSEYNHTDKKNNGKYRKQNRELAAACMQCVCTDIRWNIG